MSELSNKSVRRIFVAVAFVLPIQYLMVGIIGPEYGEPWPAFVFPGFKQIYHSGDLINLDDVDYIVEWKTDSGGLIRTQIPKDSLFKDIPRSQLSGFLHTHLRQEGQVRSISKEGINWLNARIGDLHPEKEAKELQIRWKKSTYRLDESEIQKINNRLIEELTISFDEP